MARSNVFSCKWCKTKIYLDDDVTSINGIRIPLEELAEEPHDCPEKP